MGQIRKWWKRLLLACCLGVAVLLCGGAAAAEGQGETAGDCGLGVTWALNGDGTLVISGKGAVQDGWEMPWSGFQEKIRAVEIGDGISKIGTAAFNGCRNLTAVRLPEGIEIGQYAFYGCTSLKSLTVPEGVAVSDGMCYGCTGLESVKIKGDVRWIGSKAFYGCTSLKNIQCGTGRLDTFGKVGSAAFCGCSSLKSFHLPLREVRSRTFEGCTSLETVNLGFSTGKVGNRAFMNCKRLKQLRLNKVEEIGEMAFYGCTGLKKLELTGDSLKLGAHAFTNCSCTIYGPDALEKYAANRKLAFHSISSLKKPQNTITVSNIVTAADSRKEQVFSLGAKTADGAELRYQSDRGSVKVDAYGNVTVSRGFCGKATLELRSAATAKYAETVRTVSVTVNPGSTEFGSAETSEGEGISETLLDSGYCGEEVTWELYESGLVVISGTGPMYDYEEALQDYENWDGMRSGKVNRKAVRYVEVREGVTSIGDRAFLQCENLQSVSLPYGLERVGRHAFKSCTKLRSVVIPESVEALEYYAFYGDTGLKRIQIPESVAYIDRILSGTGTVVYGYAGTEAEQYAKEAGLSFQDIPTVQKRAKKKNTIQASDVTATASADKAQTISLAAEVKGAAELSYQSGNPKITVDRGGNVTIPKGFSGKGKITVRAAATLEYQAASRTVTVTVKPAATDLSSVKNEKGAKLFVKWKKNPTGSGYQVQYSTDKNFKKKVTTKNIGKNSTTSASYKGLSKGKTYYVRIRAVKKDGKDTLYSGWSGAKRVKISK